MEYMQIREFAERVGKHVNTVDNWFKALEEQHLHYVQRVQGQKVYDEVDLKIALFIRERRDQRWSIDGIMDVLTEHCEVREFPPSETFSTPQVVNMQLLFDAIQQAAEQVATSRVDEVRDQYETLLKRLPIPHNELEARQQRVTEMVTERRVLAVLEEEAIDLWATQPACVRMTSAGLFRKAENMTKRESFIRAYVNQHYETRIRSAYGLDEDHL